MNRIHKLAVVAVGGNALIREKGKESLEDQYEAACLTMPHVVDMVQDGWKVIVTHGNGPQVGFILRRSEIAAHEVPTIPLYYGGSNTQGTIGFMFQTALLNEFRRRGMPNQAVTVVTQTLVDKNDPAFQAPSRPPRSSRLPRTGRRSMALASSPAAVVTNPRNCMPERGSCSSWSASARPSSLVPTMIVGVVRWPRIWS